MSWGLLELEVGLLKNDPEDWVLEVTVDMSKCLP